MTEPIARLNAALSDRYRIEREIGSGGMATVYLAQDLKHDRKVAVKVLKPELAAVMGTDRFLAEIRTTANLTHPHILPLHDSGEADGFLFYVMPYVEGESLRQRLDRDGQLPVGEAVRIAGRVADALDYAHRQGVIHRDIKPANILFEDEQPVVTDFGIALAVTTAGEGRLTETGLSLGTPYYMSPEQAAGDQTPTAASDVYSLGCVLYEMLTGDPPHTGSSAQAILGKILLGEVTRPAKLRRTIPTNVEGVILRALERLPADRFESVAELGAALEDKTFRHGVGAEDTGFWKKLALGLAAGFVIAGGVAVWGWLSEDPHPVRRLSLAFPADSGFVMNYGPSIALSPDGSRMVYVGPGSEQATALWLKELDQLGAERLPGTEGAFQPFFSPNGERVGFIAAGKMGSRTLKVVSLRGGGPVELARVQARVGGSWGRDGFIYVSGYADGNDNALGRVPENGGEVMPLTRLSQGETNHMWPQVLPSARTMIFTVMHHGIGDYSDAEIAAANLSTGEHRILGRGALARFAASGHLVIVGADGSLQAMPFDENDLEVGEPVQLAGGLIIGTTGYFGAADLALSSDGTLVYLAGEAPAYGDRQVMWVDRQGVAERVDPEWGEGDINDPALSPDGRALVFDIGDEDTRQIWRKTLPNGAAVRLTRDNEPSLRPRWSPDGTNIVYAGSDGEDYELRILPSDGRSAGEYEVLLNLERMVPQGVYTPGGDSLVFRIGSSTVNMDLGLLNLTTGEVDEGFLAYDFHETAPAISPDGHWLAYTSNVTGQDEVFVRPFPDVDSSITPVSTRGGTEPVWARGGGEVFFRDGDDWMTVASYSADSAFTVESVERLFDAAPFVSQPTARAYDVDPSGTRFVMIMRGAFVTPQIAEREPRLIMVQNFFTELEEKVGGGR